MKIKSVVAAGCVTLALGAWTASGSAQQPTQTPPSGTTQAGSGGSVNTDPKTQGTTDRAGQTPQKPTGNTGQPTGSLGGGPRGSGIQNGTTDTGRSGGVGGATSGSTERNAPEGQGTTGNRAGASTPTAQGTSGTQHRARASATKSKRRTGKSTHRTRRTRRAAGAAKSGARTGGVTQGTNPAGDATSKGAPPAGSPR